MWNKNTSWDEIDNLADTAYKLGIRYAVGVMTIPRIKVRKINQQYTYGKLVNARGNGYNEAIKEIEKRKEEALKTWNYKDEEWLREHLERGK